MNPNVPLSGPIQEWDSLPFVRKNIYKFLSDKLPTRMKRLVFASSLLGLLEGDNCRINENQGVGKKVKHLFIVSERDKAIVTKLNSILKLSKVSEGSLVFPMIIRSMIWSELYKNPYIVVNHQTIPITDIDTLKRVDPDFNYLTQFLIAQMPFWLLYGSYNLIHHDVSALIHQVIS